MTRQLDKDTAEDRRDTYRLQVPRSQRWNPQYDVPRNSVESTISSRSNRSTASRHVSNGDGHGRLRRRKTAPKAKPDLSDLTHWLETLSEIYMNNVENQARWEPRWINITKRERYQALDACSVTVFDYQRESSNAPSTRIVTTKSDFAHVIQSRPADAELRVVVVADLSRFVMGALGQVYNIDAEFWFEHLINSGYASSDSQLKVSNATWVRSVGQPVRFRHRALPGTGQATEWRSLRRQNGRPWVHLRWGRLGLMHYLGKMGFHEDEIRTRLRDGRWLMERDAKLNQRGLLMTEARWRLAKKEAKQKKKKSKEGKDKEDDEPEGLDERVKASNVYRPYSTFQGLPKNVTSWWNRDLRVVAPEGVSYWSGLDSDGRDTIVLVLDPRRAMKRLSTLEETPSLTFMPRPLEIQSYSDEEQWRNAGPEETYLDPPPPILSKAGLKAQQKVLKKQQEALKKKQEDEEAYHEGLQSTESFDASSAFETGHAPDHTDTDDSGSAYTSDSEYDEEYEKKLREDYKNPSTYMRDHDFARKYSFSTLELVSRFLTRLTTQEWKQNPAVISSFLSHIILDDVWQVLSEIRLDLDNLTNDLTGDLYDKLAEPVGNTKRQDLTWIKAILSELLEWVSHMEQSGSCTLHPDAQIQTELASLCSGLERARADADTSLNVLTAAMALAQSSLVIEQTSGINKVTELAFFFVPISLVTSIFSMQVAELTAAAPHIWTWVVSLCAVLLVTYLLRISARSPSVRLHAMRARMRILTDYSSTKPGSAAQQLHTLSNRAIIKFLVDFVYVLILAIALVVLFLLILLLAYGGLSLGIAAAALYFLVTRWPDPGVLAACFVSLAVAAAGIALSWYWSAEIYDMVDKMMMRLVKSIGTTLPNRWRKDVTADKDLEKEGVNTWASRNMPLFTD